MVEKSLRETMAAAHHFRPSDHNAIYVANLMTQLQQFHILSIALQVLLSLVGALTLGIAGIGLMNIMLVAVQQRTREIGVEKALGARRHHILMQFLAEALAITGVGGVCGIALAYVVSAMVGRITFYSALAKNAEDADIRLIISPTSVIVATVILAITGLVSGMIPAIRAPTWTPSRRCATSNCRCLGLADALPLPVMKNLLKSTPVVVSASIFTCLMPLLGVRALGQAPKPDSPEIEAQAQAMVAKLTLEQKIELIGGVDSMYTHPMPSIGLPRFKM